VDNFVFRSRRSIVGLDNIEARARGSPVGSDKPEFRFPFSSSGLVNIIIQVSNRLFFSTHKKKDKKGSR